MEGYSSLKFQYWVNQICSDPGRTKGYKEEKNLSKGRGDRLSLQAQGDALASQWSTIAGHTAQSHWAQSRPEHPSQHSSADRHGRPTRPAKLSSGPAFRVPSSPAGIISQCVGLRYRLWKEVKGIWLKCLPQNHPETHNLSLNPFGGESLPWIP